MPGRAVLLRAALEADAMVVAYHRYPAEADASHREVYAAWVAGQMARGLYVGWLLEVEGTVVAGAGLTLLEWGPVKGNANPVRARLSNVFTEPGWRRQGLARRLVAHCMAEAQARGFDVNLSTTPEAEALYESFGFRRADNEMRWFKPQNEVEG